jgi:hypothetical protein
MESVAWTCADCGNQIGPHEDVTEFMESRTAPAQGTSIVAGAEEISGIPHYAHVGHERTDIAAGRNKTGRVGKLHDLRADPHPDEA